MIEKLFIPTSQSELTKRKITSLDIIIISGDAYIDHPSFGTAIIARVLESKGYKVGIIDQPDIDRISDFQKLGKPNLFFAITSGNMDSMVNHYTAAKKIRHNDAYSPEGKAGFRPDRALIKYTNCVKQLYKETPIIIGGIEASLRRIPHYDFWQDKIRNSILFDTKADILCYGMAEKSIVEIADRLNNKEDIKDINDILGTVVSAKECEGFQLPEFSKKIGKHTFWEMRKAFEENYKTKTIFQKFSKSYLKHNSPSRTLSTVEMDEIYKLPFMRAPHPKYNGIEIPAFTQIKDSVTSHRGCFGGCNFCAIAAHQGKAIASRSEKSILNEITEIAKQKTFRGTISDIGGPTSNMYNASCKLNIAETCPRSSCIVPDICPHLEESHDSKIDLLEKVKNIKNVKNVFISSGVRFDLAMENSNYVKELTQKYTGGHLKLAPEHISNSVLKYMNKPDFKIYEKFEKLFFEYSQKVNKKQYIVPYIILGHPGATLNDTIELALYLKRKNMKLQQIQQFTATPMSISTCMYFTEKNFETGKKIHVAKGREIRLMKALVQWYKPENKKLVQEALRNVHKENLLKKFYK